MSTEQITTTHHWCKVQTTYPVDIGTVASATIVGTRTNPTNKDDRLASGVRGREIIAWRGFDGILRVSEARCPHQFVHLASSGTVDGCELICTAHFWRFTSDGQGSIRDNLGHREPVSALAMFEAIEQGPDLWVYLPSTFVLVEP